MISALEHGLVAVAQEGSTLWLPPQSSTGATAHGFVARMKADVTIGYSSPYVVRIDHLRINE